MLALAVGHELVRALSFAFGMFWQILWALILGFALTGVVQAVVSKQEMRRLLPDDSARSIATASVLGAASSSCSYAGWRSPGRSSVAAPTSPPRWRSSSPPPTWS